MAQPRIVDAGRWDHAGLALLSYGFRPFFLFGAAWAALAVPLWLAMLVYGIELPGPFDPLRWHAHEMIFGYLAAIIAGFALTAIPNWTGRLPLSGFALAGLVSLWLAGRFAVVFVPSPPAALVVDAAFLIILAAAVWREIAAGRNLRNLPVAVLISFFCVANLLFHLEAWWPALDGFGERLALGVAAFLIGLIGGRIVPSFTRNWMVRAGVAPLPQPFASFDKVVLAVTGIAIAAWIAAPQGTVAGAALLAAGGLHVARLGRWHGRRTGREPIVLILHVGYLWLALSLALMGAAALAPAIIAPTAGLHALTAGAIGTMTLAVMTRASLGHTGREIRAGGVTLAIYGLVTVGAVLRVVAGQIPEIYMEILGLGGLLWSGAFGLFILAYGPLLVAPGRDRGGTQTLRQIKV